MLTTFIVCSVVAGTSGSASADAWFPHPANAQWSYRWTDSAYNRSGTQEKVTVSSEHASCGWNLAWNAVGSSSGSSVDSGTVCFVDTTYGPVNTYWTSSAPPVAAPILCPWTIDPNSGSPCENSLSSALFNVTWGSRSPVLWEPLLKGTTWSDVGGAYRDVSSTNQFVGTQTVRVPAFPDGVTAAVVTSQLEASGDLGDPYGAGTRTTWWVYGVGPVKVVFAHAGGVNAPVTIVNLTSTNLRPLAAPPDQNYFPLRQGQTNVYRWTNSKHLPQKEIEKVTTAAVQNGSARFVIQSSSGPIRAIGQYAFTLRLDGLVFVQGIAQQATRLRFPPLGGNHNHFATPFDLMNWGLNPVLPGYPSPGARWRSQPGSATYRQFDVTGTTTVLGVRRVRVPAGTFAALEVKSVLHQPHHPFGSGTRYSWFAPGRGLVKLVFDHGDHSVSTVLLLR